MLAGCLGGCTHTDGLGPESAERARRRPDGVAIDPISPPPRAAQQASVADGIVTLRAPLGTDRAILVVEELFKKVVVEDGEGLATLFTRDATQVSPGASSGQAPGALLFWQGRFRKLDYRRLAGELIYREAELSVFRPTDALEALPHPSVHPEALGEGDVVVRVPIITTRLGADRLFGDELVLWMRREGDRFQIYRVLEDFQLN
jgi:hypothetical protein